MSRAVPSSPLVAHPRRFLWQRLFQYRLHTILILTALVAIWLQHEVRRATLQRQTMAFAEQFGRRPSFANRRGKWDVVKEPRFSWLHSLGMRYSFANRYPHVLYNETVTDLIAADLTDADLAYWTRLKRIERLAIETPSVTDAGMAHLHGHNEMQSLDISRSQVTDAGLKHLAGLANLQKLYLSSTQITDAGLEQVKCLSALRVLYLDETQITDAGLAHLHSLESLQDVSLRSTHVTAAGVARLQKALPHCQIER